MVPSNSTSFPNGHCDPDQLERYLSGECVPAEMEAIERHLDDCVLCRLSIEQRSADADFWKQISENLDTKRDSQAWTKVDTRMPTQPDFPVVRAKCPEAIRAWLGEAEKEQFIGRIDDYMVRDIIGSGGMGLVLRAYDPDLDRDIAIKTLKPHYADSKLSKKRFLREAKNAASLHHKNVLAVYGAKTWRDVPYVVMPFVKQGTLSEHTCSQTFDLAQVLKVGYQIASGLAAAHERSIVHRDVKPSNILLVDGLDHVVISDFGLAKAMDDEQITATGVVAGTPQFMSPEQAGGKTADVRSDLFSLGSLLYWMCTSRSPFVADTSLGTLSKIIRSDYLRVRQLRPDLPIWFETFLDQLLENQPDRRMRDGSEAARVLEALIEHHDSPSRPCLPKKLLKRPRLNFKRSVAAGLAGAVLLTVGLGSWIRFRPNPVALSDAQQPVAKKVENPSEKVDAVVNKQLEIIANKQVDTVGVEPDTSEGSQTEPSVLSESPDVFEKLDELERMHLVMDLRAGRKKMYWLKKLVTLTSDEIPDKAFNILDSLAADDDPEIRQLVQQILEKNPFVEVETIDGESP